MYINSYKSKEDLSLISYEGDKSKCENEAVLLLSDLHIGMQVDNFYNKYNVDPSGVMMCNTKDEKRIANAAKYLDWFYADENVELVSWGKEGETFEVVDGKKQYITNGSNEPVKTLYGFGIPGTFYRADREAIEATESADISASRDMVLEHRTATNNASKFVSFTKEEITNSVAFQEKFFDIEIVM